MNRTTATRPKDAEQGAGGVSEGCWQVLWSASQHQRGRQEAGERPAPARGAHTHMLSRSASRQCRRSSAAAVGAPVRPWRQVFFCGGWDCSHRSATSRARGYSSPISFFSCCSMSSTDWLAGGGVVGGPFCGGGLLSGVAALLLRRVSPPAALLAALALSLPRVDAEDLAFPS